MQVGKGQLGVCAAVDINERWLAMLEKAVLVPTALRNLVLLFPVGSKPTTTSMTPLEVDRLLDKTGIVLFGSFGFFPERAQHFWDILEEIKCALDDGKAVILHCRAGMH